MRKYQKDLIIRGCITGIESYGAFVTLDDNHSGLIHISEVSSGFVRDINDYLKIGETIYVKVIDTTDENKIKLSIKDIDYKSDGRPLEKVIETPLGFKPLMNRLPEWVSHKKEEINKK